MGLGDPPRPAALALDSQRIYVVWDENVENCLAEAGAGIYFRQRDQVERPSGTGTWSKRSWPGPMIWAWERNLAENILLWMSG